MKNLRKGVDTHGYQVYNDSEENTERGMKHGNHDNHDNRPLDKTPT
jgi:hypothetical protein